MRLLLIITFVGLISNVQSQNWDQLTNFPGGSRDDGCSFTIDNVVYCGTGRDSSFAMQPDFYSFNLLTEQWDTIGAMPFAMRRQYSSSATYNSEGYVFGGFNHFGEYLNDLWRYSPTTNSWYYLGQAPFEGRSGMQSFVIGQIFFVVGGRTANQVATNEVWGYHFVDHTWQSFSPVPGDGIWRGFGVVNGDIGIVGMGSDSTNSKRGEIYFYDLALDQWTYDPSIDTEPMTYPAAGMINNRLLLYGGEDTLGVNRNDFRYLDISTMTWNTMNSFPQEARRGVMTFCSSSDFYITTGLTSTTRINETWVARSVASKDEVEQISNLHVYVSNDIVTITGDVEAFHMYNGYGAEIPLISIAPGKFQLPAGLPVGMYICTGFEEGKMLNGKLIIQ